MGPRDGMISSREFWERKILLVFTSCWSIYSLCICKFLFSLIVSFLVLSGWWHDQHWTHSWSNQRYMHVQGQWTVVTGLGQQSDTFLLHTCSGTCSHMVCLSWEFDGMSMIFVLVFALCFIPFWNLCAPLVHFVDQILLISSYFVVGRAGGGRSNNYIWWLQVFDERGPWEAELDQSDRHKSLKSLYAWILYWL